MNKIKVIDILNKVVNGEEIPTIEYKGMRNIYYLFDKCGEQYDDSELKNILNYEVEIVEIIEEKKIPEKIKSNGKEFYCDNIDSWIDKEKTSAYCEYLMNKYNDLIDYLESKEKGE